MTLTLEITPDLENELKAAAAARGVAVEALAVERLRPKSESRSEEIGRTLRGSSTRLASLFPEPDPIATFLAQKRAETGRENARELGA